MVFLGLADDEYADTYAAGDDVQYDDAADEYQPQFDEIGDERSEPAVRRALAVDEFRTIGPDEPVSQDVLSRNTRRADKVHLVSPSRFNDAKEVGDHLRDGVPVIANLDDIDRDLRRRLVDFCSGLAYAIDGKMERVGDNVFLITPSNVEVSAEERRQLTEHGLFSGAAV